MSPRALAPGDLAPAYALPDQFGRILDLHGQLERTAVAIVFYPFAFSGICTGELREVRDTLEDFQTDDIAVHTISCDPVYALRAWADIEGHFFPLLSDFWPHGQVARAFGVFDEERGCAVRGTFLVGRDGKVVWSQVEPASTRRDFGGYREALAGLRARR